MVEVDVLFTNQSNDSDGNGQASLLHSGTPLLSSRLLAISWGLLATLLLWVEEQGGHTSEWSEVKSLSRARRFAPPWTVAHQAALSMGFSRQEKWKSVEGTQARVKNTAWKRPALLSSASSPTARRVGNCLCNLPPVDMLSQFCSHKRCRNTRLRPAFVSTWANISLG